MIALNPDPTYAENLLNSILPRYPFVPSFKAPKFISGNLFDQDDMVKWSYYQNPDQSWTVMSKNPYGRFMGVVDMNFDGLTGFILVFSL